MIGSDEIAITLTTVSQSINVVPESGQVIVSNAPKSGLKFSDFLGKFAAGLPLYKDGNLGRSELFYTEDGEEWELA
jgi:hypothetical protein